MKTGPLNESELEWLDDILTKYNTDHPSLMWRSWTVY